MTDLKNSRSITLTLIRNLVSFLHSVSHFLNCFSEHGTEARTLVLHPYYKLAYIKLAWGGEEEQAAERAAGNRYAKNWQDEVRKVLEREVSSIFSLNLELSTDVFQVEKYWKN
jgi:hypothetical protein